MSKYLIGGLAGVTIALAFVILMFYAGTGWRWWLAERDMYGQLCQGLNTIWSGVGPNLFPKS